MAERTNSVDTEPAQLPENAMISLSNSANLSPAQLLCRHSHSHNYNSYQQYISRTEETLINNSKDNNASINQNSGIFNSIVQSFRPVGTLGRGNKGTVVLVISKNSSAPFALKITSKKTHHQNRHSHQKPSPPLLLHQHLHMESYKRQQRRSSAKKKNDVEREILSMLHHPFLQTLHAHCDSGKHSLLLIDFCSGGDLNVLRHKQPEKRFSETAARFYAAEVLLALEHLHKLGIIYRDLKPENILIQDNGHIKLTDFDLSLKLKPAGARSAAAALRRSLTSSSSSSSTASFASQLHHSHSHYQQQNPQQQQIITLRDLVLVKDSEKTPLRGGHHVKKSVVRPFSCFRGCVGLHRDTDSVDSSEAETWCSNSVTELWRASVETEPNSDQAKMKMYRNKKTKKTKTETEKKHKVVCFVGTEEYVAPEVMAGAEHTPAMDWWSYGVLLYELIYGKTPFKGSCSRETLYNIMEKEAEFPGMKSSAKQLIKDLLVKEPSKRPSAETIKNHPFFHGVCWDMLADLSRPPFIPASYSVSELDARAKRKLHQLQSNSVNVGRASNSSSWIDEILRSEQSQHSSCTSSSDGELSSRSARLEYQSSTNSSAFSSSADSLSRREDNLEELSIFSNSQEWGSEYSWRR